MSYVPWERLPDKVGSIGIAIPNGQLSLAPVDDTDLHELVYTGPNVMMGYAESGADLARGDQLGGTLRTGDLATVDGEGFFYLAGRLNRFAKLYGRRFSLPDIERDLETRFPVDVAAVDHDGQLAVYVAARGEVDLDKIVIHLAVYLGVPPKSIRLHAVADIPLTSSGKKDYKVLTA